MPSRSQPITALRRAAETEPIPFPGTTMLADKGQAIRVAFQFRRSLNILSAADAFVVWRVCIEMVPAHLAREIIERQGATS